MSATTMPATHAAPAATVAEPAPASAAATRDRWRTVQFALFTAGAVLMPLGIVIIGIGWYGAAHAKYSYDQFPYLISGGVLGLGLSVVGGFLYFGAWLAKIGDDQREASRQIADAMLVLADLMGRQPTVAAGTGPGADYAGTDDPGATLVLAGPHGTTVHRRDCALIMNRDDLHVLTGAETGLTTCRVCKPTMI